MEAAALQELREYVQRRHNGTSPQAEALAQKAARLYTSTVETLRRHGGADPRFWDALIKVSSAYDELLNGFFGKPDYYLTARQFGELVLPVLQAVQARPGLVPLPRQVPLVVDLVAHCHCEALSVEQQRLGARELMRIVEATDGGPRDMAHAAMRFTALTSFGKLVFLPTARGRQGFTRAVDPGLGAELAQRGLLRRLLVVLGDDAPMAGAPVDDEFEIPLVQAAQAMAGCLLLTGDVHTLSGLAAWAASQCRLVTRLVQKIRRRPAGDMAKILNFPAARLAAQMAATCPPLLDMLKAAGILDALSWLLSTTSVPMELEEVEGWQRVLGLPQRDERVRVATLWQQAKSMGARGYEAYTGAGAASSGSGGQGHRQQQQQQRGAMGPPLSRQQLAALSVRELKQRLGAAGVDCSKCVEKEELVELLAEAQGGQGEVAGASAGSGAGRSSSSGGGGTNAAGTSAAGAGNGGSAGGGEGSESAQPADEPRLQQGDQHHGAGGSPAKRCAGCGATKAPGVKLRLCAGCRAPGFYLCGEACQRATWREHRKECKEAQRQQQEQQPS